MGASQKIRYLKNGIYIWFYPLFQRPVAVIRTTILCDYWRDTVKMPPHHPLENEEHPSIQTGSSCFFMLCYSIFQKDILHFLMKSYWRGIGTSKSSRKWWTPKISDKLVLVFDVTLFNLSKRHSTFSYEKVLKRYC